MAREKKCEDCGLAGEINHFSAKVNAYGEWFLDFLVKPIHPFTHWIARKVLGRLDPLIIIFLNFLVFLRLGKFADKPDEKDNGRTVCMWQAAIERGIKLQKFCFLDNSTNIFVARLPRRDVAFEGLPRPGRETGLEWIDNKSLVKKFFKKTDIPVARGGVCFSLVRALKIFKELGVPVVVKPNFGSRSRHARVHIKDIESLKSAFLSAKKVSPLVMVEEELKGMVFRITLVSGKIAAVLCREPPFVVGNGQETVLQLIEKANEDPRRKNGTFHEIPFCDEMEAELLFQGLSLESIPSLGKFVALGYKIGREQGGANTDFTDKIHPENRKLFEKIGKLLDEPLVGVDFIIENIEKPWFLQMPCGVIECNSLPYIDLHHHPFSGTPRDVAGMLWEEVVKVG